MSKIFISYRRSDAAGHAGRLHDRLSSWYASEEIFFDREYLKGGEVFTAAIEDAIKTARVVLVVIGLEWVNDVNRDRLHQPDDVVRQEIALALALNGINKVPVVIPILCGGAAMPKEAEFPEDVKALSEYHARTLEETSYSTSFLKLREHLAVLGISSFFQYHDGRHPYHTNGQLLSPYFADPLCKLDTLYRTLHNGGTALVVTALHGMGGVGKTQLALKFSHEYRDEYDGVWWFRAEDPLQLEEDCQELCADLLIPRRGEEAFSVSVRRWLKQDIGRWLLVYDNADKPADIRALLPEAGKHHILFTSRSPHWGGMVKRDEMIPMDSWTDEQALEFLVPRLPDAPEGILLRLSSMLGGLPLALEQACAYIGRTGASIETYCQRVEELLDVPAPDTGYPHSVLVTLSLAFESLSEPARQLLRLCAWCAPEPIPDSVFRAPSIVLAKSEEAEEGERLTAEDTKWLQDLLPEELRRVGSDDLQWGELVAELTGFALAQQGTVDLTPPGEKERQVGRTLLLHRLTQAVVAHRISDAATDVPALTELVRAAFPFDLKRTTEWPLAKCLTPHVLRLEDHFAAAMSRITPFPGS